jgi:hypothetical protein
MNSTSSINHEKIAHRAYQIWEESGRRDDNEKANWLQAESELHAQHERTNEVDADRGKSVEPPVTGQHAPDRAPHSTNYVHPGVTTDSLHHLRRR